MHKNSQKRYYIRRAVYFITTVTKERYPYFYEEIFSHVLVGQIHIAQQLMQFQLYAYAIMPDHVHLLIQPHDGYNYSKIMFSIKKQFSHNVNRVMGYNPFPDDENDEINIKLQHYRDEFLHKYHTAFPYPRFSWQKSFHDHIIRNQQDFYNHVRYISYQNKKHGTNGVIWVKIH